MSSNICTFLRTLSGAVAHAGHTKSKPRKAGYANCVYKSLAPALHEFL
jgi:hypothetical protein